MSDKEGFAKYSQFVEKMREEKGHLVEHLWYLDVINVIRVYRDKDFFERRMEELADVWARVVAYRGDKSLYDKEMDEDKPVKRSYTKAAPKTLVKAEPAKSTILPSGLMKGYGFLDDD
jgi:hypothetical protein